MRLSIGHEECIGDCSRGPEFCNHCKTPTSELAILPIRGRMIELSVADTEADGDTSGNRKRVAFFGIGEAKKTLTDPTM